MVILVDGYNVIKYLLSHHRHEHYGQREWLIGKLAAYRRAKGDERHEIIVVFDGGMSRQRHREVHGGVAVVFAGHTYIADDVIVEYAQRFHAGCVVVSNDRELGRRCAAYQAEVIKVDDFFALVNQVRHEHECEREERFGDVVITKLDDEVGHDEALDELMIAGSIGRVHKPAGDDDGPMSSTGSGKKMSKKARKRARLHKKLGN